MEQMRERVKAAVVSYAFQECQPDKGDIFGWFDDRADEIADAALSLMQPEIDRRVAEEKAKLLERLRNLPNEMAGSIAKKHFVSFEVAKLIGRDLATAFEKEQQP